MAVVLHPADGHQDHRVGKLHVVGHHQQIQRPDQVEGPGDGLALDGADGGLGDVAPVPRIAQVFAGLPPVNLVQLPTAVGLGQRHRVGVGGTAAQIVAGGEVPALAPQHDDFHVVVVLRSQEVVVQFIEHPLVLGVGLVGAGQGDSGHGVSGFVFNVSEFVHEVSFVGALMVVAWVSDCRYSRQCSRNRHRPRA